MASPIDTDAWSRRYREKLVAPDEGRLLITNFLGSDQEEDLTEPPNCHGFGRIRHFHRLVPGWVDNPLPLDPARRALGLAPTDVLEAEVFQNAACNWRCWYCYVPFNLLSANQLRSRWLSAGEMVDMYSQEVKRPSVIDLSGGQPDLAPEWVPWMMRALQERGLENTVYLWSDVNLSTDYFSQFLSEEDRDFVATYPMYGRVGCFKGFDEASFSFNTRATPELFARQFKIMGLLLDAGLDVYAYATFTTPFAHNIADKMARFVDRLQELDPWLPLRTVPLLVQTFTPVQHRIHSEHRSAFKYQYCALEQWNRQMELRYSAEDRVRDIALVPLRRQRSR